MTTKQEIENIIKKVAGEEWLYEGAKDSPMFEMLIEELTTLIHKERQEAVSNEEAIKGFLIEFSKEFEKDETLEPLQYMETYLTQKEEE